MLRIGWYRLWIAMGCFVAIFTPLQLIGDTVLPQYADDVHLGVTSCAGSTCHGATSPWKGSTVLQNEYITWDRYDPHSKAYSVLLNDVSKQMAENLGIGKAHEAKICLDCHADNVSEKIGDEYSRFRMA